MPKVGIVIVNYNGGEYQNECIRSLYDMEFKDFEIIVVDNASEDDSIIKLKSDFPEVHILEQDQNLGFARGSNIGADFSIFTLKTEYTLLINNDTVVDRGLLGHLIECSGGRYVVAPKIYYYEPNDVLWYAGGDLDWKRGNARHIGIHERDSGQYNMRRMVSFATGCCMLIPNRLIDKYGLFDEQYFMYCEDLDLCARWDRAGVGIVYEPKAVLWHKVSLSSGGDNSKLSIYYMYRNQLYFIEKYKDKMRLSARIYVLGRAAAKFFMAWIKNRNNRVIVISYLDYISGRMGRKEGLDKQSG